MTTPNRRGLMLILSSPSGAGKTTLANLLLKADSHLNVSVSYTTRKPRYGEVNGKHYHFVDEHMFLRMVKSGEFLEYAEVFGNYYGTHKDVVEEYLKRGEDVIFDIDWQGNRSLTDIARPDVVSVFILPPSKKALLDRLQNRAKDTEQTIDLRMKKANSELKHWEEYDYIIVNKDLDESLKKLLSILRAERLRKVRRLGLIDFVDGLVSEKLD